MGERQTRGVGPGGRTPPRPRRSRQCSRREFRPPERPTGFYVLRLDGVLRSKIRGVEGGPRRIRSTGRLAEWQASRGTNGAAVVTHSVNRGKGAALRTGFAAAWEAGYTHAVTMDTDGQLDPEQIPLLLAAVELVPQSMVLGWRDENRPDY